METKENMGLYNTLCDRFANHFGTNNFLNQHKEMTFKAHLQVMCRTIRARLVDPARTKILAFIQSEHVRNGTKEEDDVGFLLATLA